MIRITDLQLQTWNNKHHIGDLCVLRLDNGDEYLTRLRSPAWKLGCGVAVAQVNGKSGGWNIERIEFQNDNKT